MAAQKYVKVVAAEKANVRDAAYEPRRSKQTRETGWKQEGGHGTNGDQDAPTRPKLVC